MIRDSIKKIITTACVIIANNTYAQYENTRSMDELAYQCDHTFNKETSILTTIPTSLSKTTQEPKKLYHDKVTDQIRIAVKLLTKIEPYSNDEQFLTNANALTTKLTRDNIAQYADALHFFHQYPIAIDKEMKYKIGIYTGESISNVNHYASHALADMHATQKNYLKAIEYYHKAIAYKYHTMGTTRYVKCLERIYIDLAEVYFASENPDMAVVCLLAVVSQDQYGAKYADKKLVEYRNTINAEQYKRKIDRAIASITLVDKSHFIITFGEGKILAKIMFYASNIDTIKYYLSTAENYTGVSKKQ